MPCFLNTPLDIVAFGKTPDTLLRYRQGDLLAVMGVMSRRDVEDIFLWLNDRWALSYDRLQWLVMQQKKTGRWQAVFFIASEKRMLQRVLREKGCDSYAQGRKRASAYA